MAVPSCIRTQRNRPAAAARPWASPAIRRIVALLLLAALPGCCGLHYTSPNRGFLCDLQESLSAAPAPAAPVQAASGGAGTPSVAACPFA